MTDPTTDSWLRGAPTRLWASAADAPRQRRPNDWVVLVLATAVAVGAGWAAGTDAAVDSWSAETLADTPGWLSFLSHAAYVATGVYALGLAGVIVFRGGKRAIRRDIVLAVAATVVIVIVAGHLAVDRWPDVLPEFIGTGDILSYPVFRIAVAGAVIGTAAPHLTMPVRRLGRRLLVLGALGGVVIGYSSITGLVGALAIGRGVAALVHVVFGSPAGLPSEDRLSAALTRLGLSNAAVTLLDPQPVGSALARVDTAAGPRLAKVYGRDAADAEFVSKVWRGMWYRDAGPALSLTGMQQAEHEAVISLLAARSEVPVPTVELLGQDEEETAFLVTPWPDAVPLLWHDDLDDECLDRAWEATSALHDAHLSHGAISPSNVLVSDDGGIVLADLSRGSLAPADHRIHGDVVSLVASLATVVGVERAVDSLLRSLPEQQVIDALPYFQDGVLTPELRRALKPTAKLSDVGEIVVDRIGVEKPPTAPVRRVQLSDIVLVVFGIIAVNAILSQIAEIGFDTLMEELRNASLGWLVVAFVIGLTGYFGDVISLRGALTSPVPLAPTLLLQSAKKFIGLAVPSMAGRVALDVRFLQKQGVPSSVALAQGPLIGFVGFLAEVVLLLLGAWSAGQAIDTDNLDSGNLGTILLLVVVFVVVGLVIVFAVPKLRAIVLPPIREAVGSVTDVIRDPRRIGRIFAGQLLDRIISALALAATLAAFGETVAFGAVVFVSVGTGLLAGLAPVPGGIGVAEATMTALLTAVGVPAEIAFAAAITYRLVTSYLPPVLGFFSFHWLTDNRYL